MYIDLIVIEYFVACYVVVYLHFFMIFFVIYCSFIGCNKPAGLSGC